MRHDDDVHDAIEVLPRVWVTTSRRGTTTSTVLVAADATHAVLVDPAWQPDELDALAPFVAQAAVLVPGHGRPTSSPLARLDADRRYLDAVTAGRTVDPVDEPRLRNDGMAGIHEQIVRLARG